MALDSNWHDLKRVQQTPWLALPSRIEPDLEVRWVSHTNTNLRSSAVQEEGRHIAINLDNTELKAIIISKSDCRV